MNKLLRLVCLVVLIQLCFCNGKRIANPFTKIAQSISKFRVNAITVDRTIPRNIDIQDASPLDVRIDDVWYDLSKWRKAHPAGEHWIDLYRGRDATEVMHAFHSAKGRGMYARLPKSKNAEELDMNCAPVSQLSRNFRALRQQLEADGWWERNIFHEVKLISIWTALTVAGVSLASSIPLLGVVLLALSQTTAGWLAHDYAHGVDKTSFALRNFGCICAGLSPTWWSDKHNKVSRRCRTETNSFLTLIDCICHSIML